MAWRVIAIENPARLSLRNGKLIVWQDEEVAIPIEDIDSLVLDNVQIVMTLGLVAKLAEFGVATVICDEKHHPASVILPYCQHSRQKKVSAAQIKMGDVMKGQIWMRIVVRKIENQAVVMGGLGFDNSRLVELAREVRPGDKGGAESVAARIYFAAVLGDATRRRPMWHNSALNCGYAIVRGVLARSVAARGLIASQGIFHHSELNQFNLVDDLIEPFRPVVDEYVLGEVAEERGADDGGWYREEGVSEVGDARLSVQDRRKLIDVLNKDVIIRGKRFSVKHACDIAVESFVQATMEERAYRLCLPEIVK